MPVHSSFFFGKRPVLFPVLLPAEQQPEGAAAKKATPRPAPNCWLRSMLKGRKMSSDIMPFMAKHVVHISEAEAASNFADVLARVRAGVEVVIGGEVGPVAVVRPAEPHVRLLSESLRLAKEHASTATLDEDFARDLFLRSLHPLRYVLDDVPIVIARTESHRCVMTARILAKQFLGGALRFDEVLPVES